MNARISSAFVCPDPSVSRFLQLRLDLQFVFADYIRKPKTPNWSYVVVNEQALYDGTNAVDFELHKSEENNLIFKILQLAGITMDPNLYQIATQEEIKTIQQEKA